MENSRRPAQEHRKQQRRDEDRQRAQGDEKAVRSPLIHIETFLHPLFEAVPNTKACKESKVAGQHRLHIERLHPRERIIALQLCRYISTHIKAHRHTYTHAHACTRMHTYVQRWRSDDSDTMGEIEMNQKDFCGARRYEIRNLGGQLCVCMRRDRQQGRSYHSLLPIRFDVFLGALLRLWRTHSPIRVFDTEA